MAFLSGCIGGDEGRSLPWCVHGKPLGLFTIQSAFIYAGFKNSNFICQLLLPRLKKETIWLKLYFPNHIIDGIQSPSKVPTNFTDLQGTWQGVPTQQQEMVYVYPLHTQPHFSPPLPKIGRLHRPCCLLKL